MSRLPLLPADTRKARALSMTHEQRTARTIRAYSLRLFRDLAKANNK